MARRNGSGTVRIDGREVAYTVSRSARSKYVRLVIGHDQTVRIVVPELHRLGDVRELLQSHREWILAQFDGLASRQASAPADGTALPYLGETIKLVLTHARTSTIRRGGQQLILRGPVDDPLFVLGALEGWYREEARDVLTERVVYWSRRMDVQPRRITIRDQRTRWGSCSSVGNLNFSWRLVMAPMPVLEYVVIHELAHLREQNHSPGFWAIVQEHSPDYVEHKRWLRDEGPRLAEYLMDGYQGS